MKPRGCVAYALVVVTALLGTPTSASALALAPPSLWAPRFWCNPVGGEVTGLSKMERINPYGWEQWERQTWFKDVSTGKWISTPWRTSIDAETGLRIMGPERPGIDVTIDLSQFPGPGNVFFDLQRDSHYYAGIFYRWWWWNDATRSWSVQTSWVFAHPRYSNGVPTGNYWDMGHGTPAPWCSTGEASVMNVPWFGSGASTRLRQLSRASRSDLSDEAPPSTDVARVTALDADATCFQRMPTIVGSEDSDVLVGTPHADVILSLGGDDQVFGGGGSDLICGGEGNDGMSGGNGADKVAGEAGDDVFLGDGGGDLLIGGDGIDIMEGGAGGDRLRGGGQPLDILSYLFSPTGVEVDFSTGMARGAGGLDRFDGFNAVVGSKARDVLRGDEGEQWFVPLGGDDAVDGGAGSDVIAYVVSERGVDVDLVTGRGTGEGDDSLVGLEVVAGSPYDDTIAGDAGYNLLFGGFGDDTLEGAGGGDTLEGGEGTDVCKNGDSYVDCENRDSNFVLTQPPESETEPPVDDPPTG